MRYLLLFMLVVAVFVLGKNHFHFGPFSSGVKGEGPVQTQTRNVSDFRAISLEIAGDVAVSIGDHCSVEVSGQQNILNLLKTEVSNGELKIYFEENVSYKDDVTIRITMPSLESVSIGGSGQVKVDGLVKSEMLDLSIGGSGDISIPQIETGKLECSIAGSGSVVVGGKTADANIDIAGSGDFAGKEMSANTVDVGVSGSGSATCGVIGQSLKADVSGSGEIYYSGTPAVNSNVSGSGGVHQR